MVRHVESDSRALGNRPRVAITGTRYYAPQSEAPASSVAGITGLYTVSFPRGGEMGLLLLRDLLRNAGLRELEREATFATENGRTSHANGIIADRYHVRGRHRRGDRMTRFCCRSQTVLELSSGPIFPELRGQMCASGSSEGMHCSLCAFFCCREERPYSQPDS